MDKETLLSYEPKLAKLFIHSRERKRLSNAYLLYGPRNAPLKEIAIYLCQSLSCQKDLLACNECEDCLRFIKGIRPDFHLIEGDRETIKKDQVKDLEKAFSLSALEKGHTLTYVISDVDNITEEAANALLKFLEEPREGQVAFLTTTNPTRVLPTIRSRCLSIRIDPIESTLFFHQLEETIFQDAKGKEIALSRPSLYLLSRLFPSKSEIAETLLADETLPIALDKVEEILNALLVSKKAFGYAALLSCQQIKESRCYNWMYLSMDALFDETLLQAHDGDNPFHDVLSFLSTRREALLGAKEILRKALSLRQINLSNTCLMAELIQKLSEVY